MRRHRRRRDVQEAESGRDDEAVHPDADSKHGTIPGEGNHGC